MTWSPRKLIGRPPVNPVAAFCCPSDDRRVSGAVSQECRMVRRWQPGAWRAPGRPPVPVAAAGTRCSRGFGRPGQMPQPGQQPQQINPRPLRDHSHRGHAQLVGIVLVPAFKDAVHTHDSVPAALAHYCCRCYNKSIPSVTHAEGTETEHTSKERTWEVVRDAHAYRPVP